MIFADLIITDHINLCYPHSFYSTQMTLILIFADLILIEHINLCYPRSFSMNAVTQCLCALAENLAQALW